MHMSTVPSNDASEFQNNNTSVTRGMGWLLPLLLLVLVTGLIFYFLKGSDLTPIPVAPQFTEATDTAHKGKPSKIDSGSAAEIVLPDHSVMTVSKDGIEEHLIEYLNNPRDTISKNRWFNFDSLYFENDNITLTQPSMHQIRNVVSILKTYPKTKIKIGAFTEKTNDEAADLKLTQQQADEVAAALRKAGANSAQIVSAEGYGSKYAKAEESATAEEKIKDKKISINVAEK
jgi:outer membrane protein OmpA-like peptidoglycan-associated protein